MSGGRETVTFYYDFSSPYAYLGATQIERVAQAHGATVDWRPVLVGALFRELGTPLVPVDDYPAAKRSYVIRDLMHWAAHWQVDFRWPSRFPMRTVLPLRLAVAAALDAPARDNDASAQLNGATAQLNDAVAPSNDAPAPAIVAVSRALFHAYWVEDRDIADADVVRAVAREHGLPSETIERAIAPAPDVKEALIANGRQALAAGLCGVPTFMVRSHIFWGQDRLDLVGRVLAGWEPPRR